MPTEELEKINANYISSRDTTILIPEDRVIAFYLRYDNSVHAATYEPPSYDIEATQNVKRDHMLTHNVRMGEDLHSIAKKYNSSVEEIYRVNHKGEGNSLLIDTMIVVPVTKEVFENYSNGFGE